MATTVADLKNRIQQKIHGQSLDKLQDVYGLLKEAGANVLSRVDLPETQRAQALTGGLFDDVRHYACPSDLKKDKVIAVRPSGASTVADVSTLVGQDTLYRTPSDGDFAVEYRNGTKVLKVAKTLTLGATLHSMDSLTSNGTWAATASAQNLAADTVVKLSGSASLAFDLAAAGSSGYIENSAASAVDLSGANYGTSYSVFVPLYLPSASAITSATLRWGSASGAYYAATVTATTDATALAAGWNVLRFDRSAASETGSVDDAAIDYLRLTVAYGGTAVSGIRVGAIVARIPTPYEVSYYSAYMFRSSAGTWLEAPTADTDIVNAEADGVSALVYEASMLAAQELMGEDAQADLVMLRDLRDAAESAISAGTRSEAKKRRRTYYRMR